MVKELHFICQKIYHQQLRILAGDSYAVYFLAAFMIAMLIQIHGQRCLCSSRYLMLEGKIQLGTIRFVQVLTLMVRIIKQVNSRLLHLH